MAGRLLQIWTSFISFSTGVSSHWLWFYLCILLAFDDPNAQILRFFNYNIYGTLKSILNLLEHGYFGIFGQDTGRLYTESAYISYLNNGVPAKRQEYP